MVDLRTSVESKMLECFGMDNHDDKIRADERRKFAEWFKQSNYYLCYSDTIDEVLYEYEIEQKGGAKTDIEKLDAEIRAVERRKLLNWLDDNDALGTEVYDGKHDCYYHQRLSVEEVLRDYEDSLKEGTK